MPALDKSLLQPQRLQQDRRQPGAAASMGLCPHRGLAIKKTLINSVSWRGNRTKGKG